VKSGRKGRPGAAHPVSAGVEFRGQIENENSKA
jgi:hypothetical protein